MLASIWTWIQKFSLKKVINAAVRHLLSSLLVDSAILIGVFVFLWFFYCAVADRIFPTVDTASVSSGDIVNPLAYQTAFDNANWLVLLFPFIFFSLIALVHHLWGKWRWFGVTLGTIFILDYVVASISSRKVHEYLLSQVRGYNQSWSFWFWASDYYAHVAIVVLCGFGTSFAAGMLYHALKEIVDASDADTVDIED